MTYPGPDQPQPPIIPATPPMPPQMPPPPPWGYQPRYYPPPPPPKKGMPAWEIILIILGSVVGVLVIVGVTISNLGGSLGGGGPKSPTYDVVSCSYDGFATTLEYQIRNNDTKPHTYYVQGTVAHSPTIPDVLENVAPGETATGKMIGTEQGGCAITKVQQQ